MFRICSCFIICTLSLGEVGCAAIARDEPLDEEAATFFATAQKPNDQNNASIGLLGLSAPAGQDFMAYGRTFAAMWGMNSDASPEKRTEESNSLKIKWDQMRMDCWTDDYEPFDQDPKCAPIEEATQTLRDNAELLSRYQQIQKMATAPGYSLGRATPFMVAAKLAAVEIKVDRTEGRATQAYRKWADQHVFLRNMNSTGGIWLEVAVNLVNEGISLSVIESLLFRAPHLIDNHYDELITLLAAGNIARFNIPGIMRSEHALFMQSYEFKEGRKAIFPNYITNRHYRHAKRVIEIASGPASLLDDGAVNTYKCFKEMEKNETDPRFSASAEYIQPSMSFELIKSMHAKNRLMNLLTMRVRIFKDRVPDSQIAAYLKANTADMREPFTNGTMQWDKGKRVLFYDNPKYKGATEVRL